MKYVVGRIEIACVDASILAWHALTIRHGTYDIAKYIMLYLLQLVAGPAGLLPVISGACPPLPPYTHYQSHLAA